MSQSKWVESRIERSARWSTVATTVLVRSRRRGISAETFAVIGELFGGREAIGWRAAGETADHFHVQSPTLIETEELDRSD